jgi:hypothetical protein
MGFFPGGIIYGKSYSLIFSDCTKPKSKEARPRTIDQDGAPWSVLVENPDHLLKGGLTPMQLLCDLDLQGKDLPYMRSR